MNTGARHAERIPEGRVCVAGLGVSGPPVVRALAAHGREVVAVDARDDEPRRALAAELEATGATIRLGDGDTLPVGTSTVVTSPGWRPDSPLLRAASAAGVPVIGDVELAWRLRPTLADGRRQPWLGVTGTNGKTTTVKMLAAMLAADGVAVAAAGNVGTSIIEAVRAAEPHEVIVVELSSFQLHWSNTLAPFAATVLNLAPDHLDWHGGMRAYAEAKGRVFAPGTIALHNADDSWSVELAARAAESVDGGSFTAGPPRPGQLGVSDGALTDRTMLARRAFRAGPWQGGDGEAVELAAVSDVRPSAPHNVANALAAAGLARAYGLRACAVRDGLRAFHPEPHRIARVATIDGVVYVDDSKATNPHAAAASISAYRDVVWIAGGLLKGADVDELVAAAAPRLRGAVLIGADRAEIRRALARHAPNVPVVEDASPDTGAMDRVVAGAARLAVPGDTVLLAPAAASFDMFTDYTARGDAFAAAVQRLASAEE